MISVAKMVILNGLPNSGKTGVLKRVAQSVLKAKGAKLLGVFLGASWRRPATVSKIKSQKGDVTVLINTHGRIVIIVTMGDDKNVANRVKSVIDRRFPAITRIDRLIVATRASFHVSIRSLYKVNFSIKSENVVYKPRSYVWKHVVVGDRQVIRDYWVGRVRALAHV